MKEMNQQIDDIFETINVSEALLRIKEITGRQVSVALPCSFRRSRAAC